MPLSERGHICLDLSFHDLFMTASVVPFNVVTGTHVLARLLVRVDDSLWTRAAVSFFECLSKNSRFDLVCLRVSRISRPRARRRAATKTTAKRDTDGVVCGCISTESHVRITLKVSWGSVAKYVVHDRKDVTPSRVRGALTMLRSAYRKIR